MNIRLGTEDIPSGGPEETALNAATSEVPTIYFEVSDLVYYYAGESTPTGMQRVQQELAKTLLTESTGNIVAVIYDRDYQKWRTVPTDRLLNLIFSGSEFRGTREGWAEIYWEFSSKLSDLELTQFEPGAWLVNVGNSCYLPSYFIQVRQLRRRGVRFAVFLHDCIPVRHPAYFEHHHTIEHTYWLAQLPETADVVICNSETTRNDYLEFVKPPSPDNVFVCTLDASWADPTPSAKSDMAASELLSDMGIIDDDFVLCVGTIEPRKNHIALVHVWDKLRETHSTNCPKLVCVGRVGWKSDAVISQAKALGLMNNQVFFTGALPDDILAVLYRKCLFSVYVSYFEGWGLPVTESLRLGKVCVTGSSGALKEAGAGCTIHVDERSQSAIYDVITQLLGDRSLLHAAEARIRKEFRGRDWPAVGAQIKRIVAGVPYDSNVRPAFPRMQMNALYKFGRSKPIVNFSRAEAAELFCIGQAWHQPEQWGCWTSKESAELGFRIDRTHLRPTIFLGLLPPPGGSDMSVSVNGKPLREFFDVSGRKIVRFLLDDFVPAEGGKQSYPVRIRVTVSKTKNMRAVPNSTDARTLGAAFLFITCFDSDSVVERLEFLEKLITDDLTDK